MASLPYSVQFLTDCTFRFQGLIAVGLLAAPRRLEDAIGNSEHVGFFYSFNNGGADAVLLAAQIVGTLFIIGWVMLVMLPFFVWLDWRGWFRSDPLEEIVGLDTSYHGGLMLGGEDQINPEYVTAFNKRREENVRSKSSRNPHISNTVLTEFDHDDNYSQGGNDLDRSLRSFKDGSVMDGSIVDQNFGRSSNKSFDPAILDQHFGRSSAKQFDPTMLTQAAQQNARAEIVIETAPERAAPVVQAKGGVSVDL